MGIGFEEMESNIPKKHMNLFCRQNPRLSLQVGVYCHGMSQGMY